MDAIDEALLLLFDLIKMIFSVLFETTKTMVSVFTQTISMTFNLLLKKRKWITMESEKTVQEFFKLWFWNFQNPSLNQFSNLYNITLAILKYYDKKNVEDSKNDYANEINNHLPKLFYTPIETLSDKNQHLKIKTSINWNIAHLEWCYHRDTKFKTKLSKEYYSDSRKQAEKQMLHLQEIVTILSLFKSEMFEIVVKILLDEKLDIMIPIPIHEIEQIGGETWLKLC